MKSRKLLFHFSRDFITPGFNKETLASAGAAKVGEPSLQTLGEQLLKFLVQYTFLSWSITGRLMVQLYFQIGKLGENKPVHSPFERKLAKHLFSRSQIDDPQ